MSEPRFSFGLDEGCDSPKTVDEYVYKNLPRAATREQLQRSVASSGYGSPAYTPRTSTTATPSKMRTQSCSDDSRSESEKIDAPKESFRPVSRRSVSARCLWFFGFWFFVFVFVFVFFFFLSYYLWWFGCCQLQRHVLSVRILFKFISLRCLFSKNPNFFLLFFFFKKKKKSPCDRWRSWKHRQRTSWTIRSLRSTASAQRKRRQRLANTSAIKCNCVVYCVAFLCCSCLCVCVCVCALLWISTTPCFLRRFFFSFFLSFFLFHHLFFVNLTRKKEERFFFHILSMRERTSFSYLFNFFFFKFRTLCELAVLLSF